MVSTVIILSQRPPHNRSLKHQSASYAERHKPGYHLISLVVHLRNRCQPCGDANTVVNVMVEKRID